MGNSKDALRQDRSALVAELQAAGAPGPLHGKSCRCPFHDDRNESGSIHQGKAGGWRFTCHACRVSGDLFDLQSKRTGRPVADLLRDLHQTTTYTPPKGSKQPMTTHKKSGPGYSTPEDASEAMDKTRSIVNEGYTRTQAYTYTDAASTPVGVVLRYERPDLRPDATKPEKTFRQITRHPDGQWRLDGAGLDLWPLYRLPEVAADRQAGEPVILCEGEKATDALRRVGFNATTTCGGAGKANKADLAPLAGASVVLWPDNDEAGQTHAGDLLARLAALSPPAVVRMVEVADLTPKADAADLTPEQAKAKVADALAAEPVKLPEPVKPAGFEEADIVCLADIEREEIEWLYKGVLAVGKIHVIAGNPGEGKSTIALDFSARLTYGHLFPFDETSPAVAPASVVVFAGEDDPADTLRPRLEAAGADVKRIFILQGRSRWNAEGGKKNLGLTLADIPSIEDAIKRAPNCRMVVIDPLMAFMGKADAHKDAEVRGLLHPLGQLAAKYRVAVLIVAHLNKGKGTDAAYRVGGSIGISAAARIVLGVGQDRKDKELRWLTPIKCNIAKDRWGMAYTIEEFEGSTRIAWKERNNDMNAQDLWAEPSAGEHDREELDAITKAFLATKTGGAKAEEVIGQAKAEGYGMKAARSSLHRVAQKVKADFQGETKWRLKD